MARIRFDLVPATSLIALLLLGGCVNCAARMCRPIAILSTGTFPLPRHISPAICWTLSARRWCWPMKMTSKSPLNGENYLQALLAKNRAHCRVYPDGEPQPQLHNRAGPAKWGGQRRADHATGRIDRCQRGRVCRSRQHISAHPGSGCRVTHFVAGFFRECPIGG